MSLTLFLIRHAESANNRLAVNLTYEEYMQRRFADPSITELGEAQALRLAEHLHQGLHPELHHEPGYGTQGNPYGITHIYCSPMLRTLQTVLPIYQRLEITPHVWINIHEHGGIFVGNPRSGEGLVIHPGLRNTEIEEHFPGIVLPAEITNEGWWNSSYEDMPACYARAMRVARDLRQRAKANGDASSTERLALISHGTFLDSLLKAFFNQIPDRALFYFHYNTAITRLDIMGDGTIFLRYLNRVQHLPPEMISE
jgi:2,3-bisphosphoglycerate-dependent phosphoglycerate mutase